MKTIELTVQPRTGTGKGPNRRARVQGMMPGVVYGHDLKPKAISVAGAELKKLDRVVGSNVFINMKVDGDAELNGKTVRVREFQTHPLKHNLIHADFVTVDLNKPIVVEVPVELVGKPVGLQKQGVLNHVAHEIEVRCLPKDIPEKIQVDVSALDILESLHIADVKLPENVKAVYTDNYTIATVAATREEKVEVVVAEAVPGAEGAAAAPGAPGAAAPAAGAAGAKPAPGAAAGAKAPAAGGDKGGAKK